jgi:hypothetical protein
MKINLEKTHPDAAFVYFESKNGVLNSYVHRCGPHPTNGAPGRGCCVDFMVKEAYELSKKPDFEFIVGCSDETSFNPQIPGVKVFYFYTSTENYDETVPCYGFHSLSLKGRYGFSGEGSDYHEDFVSAIIESGNQAPESDKAGFAGTIGNHVRSYFFGEAKKKPFSDFCEFIEVSWYDPSQHKQPWPSNFISIPDQVKRWRFIIDIQGLTWADRTKYYFFSNRPIIMVERPYKEFYFQHLKPWVHYVPAVTSEDVCENLTKLLENPDLEREIANNALEFAKNNMTRNSAINRYKDVIDSFA